MKGKNKMVPRLLGITKDGIIRVDSKTKEVLKTFLEFYKNNISSRFNFQYFKLCFYGISQTIKYYDLTSVRRWAASPNTFTLVRVLQDTFSLNTSHILISTPVTSLNPSHILISTPVTSLNPSLILTT